MRIGSVSGIYAEVRADYGEFQKDLASAKKVATGAAREISDSLGNALSPQTVRAGVESLVRNLSQVQKSARLTGTAFEGVGVDLKNLQRLTGMSEASWKSLQTRMLETGAARAADKALAQIAKSADLSRLEMIRLRRELGDAEGAFKQFGQLGAGHLKSITGSVFNFRNALVGLGLGIIAKDFVGTAASFETLGRSLETNLGSASRAREALAWIQVFAAETPFQLEEVAGAFRKLAAYGMEPAKYLQGLGDTASAMGKTLDDAVEMFADAATGEFERLKEFGVRASTAGDQVTFSWQQNGQEMTKTVQKTQTGITTALGEIFQRFDGNMKRQMTAWDGLWSNLMDIWSNAERQIMDAGPFDAMKDQLKDFLDYLGSPEGQAAIQGWAEGIGSTLASLGDGLKAVTIAATAFGIAMAAIKWDTVSLGAMYAADAVRKMTLAMATNPVTAMAAAVSLLIGVALTAEDANEKAAESLKRLGKESEQAASQASQASQALKSAETALENYDKALQDAGGDARKQTEAVNQLKGAFPGLVAQVSIGALKQEALRAAVVQATAALRAQAELANQKAWEALQTQIQGTLSRFSQLGAQVDVTTKSMKQNLSEGLLGRLLASGDESKLNDLFKDMQGRVEGLVPLFNDLAQAKVKFADNPEIVNTLNGYMEQLYSRAKSVNDQLQPGNPASKGLSEILAKLKAVMDAGSSSTKVDYTGQFLAALEKEDQARRAHSARIAKAQLEADQILLSSQKDSQSNRLNLLRNWYQTEEAELRQSFANQKISKQQFDTEMEALDLLFTAKQTAITNERHQKETEEWKRKAEDRRKVEAEVQAAAESLGQSAEERELARLERELEAYRAQGRAKAEVVEGFEAQIAAKEQEIRAKAASEQMKLWQKYAQETADKLNARADLEADISDQVKQLTMSELEYKLEMEKKWLEAKLRINEETNSGLEEEIRKLYELRIGKILDEHAEKHGSVADKVMKSWADTDENITRTTENALDSIQEMLIFPRICGHVV